MLGVHNSLQIKLIMGRHPEVLEDLDRAIDRIFVLGYLHADEAIIGVLTH